MNDMWFPAELHKTDSRKPSTRTPRSSSPPDSLWLAQWGILPESRLQVPDGTRGYCRLFKGKPPKFTSWAATIPNPAAS